MTDWYQQEYPSGVVIIGSQIRSRASVVARVSMDLLERGLHAGILIANISKLVGGRGGGKPTLAQGGGNEGARLDDALAAAEEMVERALAEQG
jgi:alanyl-tRNA synthetase